MYIYTYTYICTFLAYLYTRLYVYIHMYICTCVPPSPLRPLYAPTREYAPHFKTSFAGNTGARVSDVS